MFLWINLQNLLLSSISKIIIGQNCFSRVESLKSILIYSKQVTIGVESFQKCSSLKKVDFIYQVGKEIDENVKKNTSITDINNKTKINELFIGDEAFNLCNNLEELIIDVENIVYIGEKCFYQLDNLINIKITTGRLSKGPMICKDSFSGCPGHEDVPEVFFENKEYGQNSSDYVIKKIIRKKKYDQAYVKDKYANTDNYESFLIVGVESKQVNPKKPKASLIAMFPSFQSEQPIDLIVTHCYPHGLKKINRFNSKSNILDGFVFLFANPKKVGVVVHFNIPDLNKSFVGPNYSNAYPFSLCLISNNPNISSHFIFLCEIAEAIINNSSLIVPINLLPDKLFDKKENCYKDLILDPNSDLIAISPLVKSLQFILPKLISYYVNYKMPTLDQNDYLLFPTLQVLLSNLSPENIVNTYLAILFDYHIIFVSKDLNKLTFSILAATYMIKELDIASIINPALPDTRKLIEFANCTAPYIIGFHKPIGNYDFVVNLDKNQISFYDEYKRKIPGPNFPYARKLVAKINDLMLLNSLDIKYTKENISNANEFIYPKCFQFFTKTKYILTPIFIRQ